MYELSEKSRKRMEGVHPHLIRVVERAIQLSTIDFTVTEGVRTLEKQQELMKAGASKTLRSRHLSGHAVDLAALVGGHVRWDWPLYDQIALAMKVAAEELNVPLEWGGDWTTFKDGPHFQLPWKDYPINDSLA